MPKDLDDTYTRILEAIDNDGNHVQVFKILQLLVCSNEPVSLAEAAEIIPIELDSTPQVDLERRLVDPHDVMTMCSALLILETQEDNRNRRTVLRLAHFSIREFLLSIRIQKSTVSHWYMDDISSHLFIARLLIAYLLFLEVDVDECEVDLDEGAGNDSLYTQFYSEYPLAAVAASRWPKHLSIAENSGTDLTCGETASQLFTAHSAAKISQIVFELIYEEQTQHCKDCVNMRHGPLAFAAHHNLPQTARYFLARGANPNTLFNIPRDLESTFTTPLAEASRMGHLSVVKELLTHQADVELERQECLNALKRACLAGHTEVVRLLLDHGANPNACLPGLQSALEAAVMGRYSQRFQDTSGIVKLLLEAGANINGTGGSPRSIPDKSIIEFAVDKHCDTPTIKVLLDHGADAVEGLVAAGSTEGASERVLFFWIMVSM